MKLNPLTDFMRCRSVLMFSYCLIISSTVLGQSGLTITGIKRVPHSIESEMKYKEPHSADSSAWYQVFFLNNSNKEIPVAKDIRIEINGKTPNDWHRLGSLSWFQFPVSEKEFPESIPPMAMFVGQFNGKNSDWLVENQYQFRILNLDTVLRDEEQQIRLTTAVFTGQGNSYDSDQLTVHIENTSAIEFQLIEANLWLPSEAVWPFLYRSRNITAISTMPQGGIIGSGKKLIAQVKTENIPPGPVAIELHLKSQDGKSTRIWSFQKVKKESFDISAGWANGKIGKSPAFLNKRFLQTMESLYINTAHYTGQPGYSDQSTIYNLYPIKYFGHLKPWQVFDQDSLLGRIHGVEILGEPQYGGGTPVDPQKVCDELTPYHRSRLTTTLTHSEERIWRFYAGLSDYPHYDAYRVTAPSADEWNLYDRWNGKRIGWGSPLETIGTMTRSLKKLNRPLPIAYWSQGPHEGWEVYGGRKRTSPTPSELRSQAYHALASGITSLYWFNLSYRSLILYPELLAPMQTIGRQIKLLEEIFLTGDQWFYERISQKGKPLWDLSTVVSPHGVLLFALDLDYKADSKTRTFIFKSEQSGDFTFKIPEWIGSDWRLLKVGEEELKNISFSISSPGEVVFKDSVTETGMYLFVSGAGEEQRYRQMLHSLLQRESSLDFNPSKNPNHLNEFTELEKKIE